MCNMDYATSAYNFIQLPERILEAPVEKTAVPQTDVADNKQRVLVFKNYVKTEGKHSGYIQLDIEALTPLFIGGEEIKDQNNNVTEMKFFAPVNDPVIPGSTIRGLVKNIFKIVTCGAMRPTEDFYDRRLFFRCLMAAGIGKTANKSLHKYYAEDRMTSKNAAGKVSKVAQPGFLVRSHGDYSLCKVNQLHKILIYDYEQLYGPIKDGRKEKDCSEIAWKKDEAGNYKEVYIITGKQDPIKTKEEVEAFIANTPEKLRYKLGKQYIAFFKTEETDWGHPLPVPDTVIDEYKADKNRRGINVLEDQNGVIKGKEAEKISGISGADRLSPCFYVMKGNQIDVFGHGQSFRIPYKNKISDAIPKELQFNQTVDFSDEVFGKKELWAGRVFFEDALPLQLFENEKTDYIQPLMQPNPTSFQLYLQQPEMDVSQLKYWDQAGARIRGYKLYWHKKPERNDWIIRGAYRAENDRRPANKKLSKKITPVSKKSCFRARIRFRELSDIELGALLEVFYLAGYTGMAAYKLGMGKPLGMGSVQIKTKLFEEDDAYQSLFKDNAWNNSCRQKETSSFTKAFEDYVRTSGMENEWQHIMNALCCMLEWNNVEQDNWNNRTKMMESNVQSGDIDERFQKRAPLPLPEDVVQGDL